MKLEQEVYTFRYRNKKIVNEVQLEQEVFYTYRPRLVEGDEVWIMKVGGLTRKNLAFVETNLARFKMLHNTAQTIVNTGVNNFYKTYYIPKRSGGRRKIDEPADVVKAYTKDVVKYFTRDLHFSYPTGVAYAYLPRQNAVMLAGEMTDKTCILHYDLKDFFGSCTLDVVMASLVQIYPFCLFDQSELRTVVSACMLEYDGALRLSQGAPSSPFWSNLAMLPVDMKLRDVVYYAECDNWRMCPVMPTGRYTRYADDIYIGIRGYSPKKRRQYLTQTMVNRFRKRVEAVIAESDFELNTEKTAQNYTRHGNVRVLGMSVGKAVKLGAKKKARLRATIWRMMMDYRDGKVNPELRSQAGQVAYARQVEPAYVGYLIWKYEQKSGVKYDDIMKQLQG